MDYVRFSGDSIFSSSFFSVLKIDFEVQYLCEYIKLIEKDNFRIMRCNEPVWILWCALRCELFV